MTAFPRALGTQISEPKTGAPVQGQVPGEIQGASVSTETRVQTTPVTRKREAENRKLVINLQTGWEKGDGEERRQTSNPPRKRLWQSDRCVGARQRPWGLFGGWVTDSWDPMTSVQRASTCLCYFGSTNLGSKPCGKVWGLAARHSHARMHSHSLGQPSPHGQGPLSC